MLRLLLTFNGIIYNSSCLIMGYKYIMHIYMDTISTYVV